MSFPPLAELVPQAAPMILLDEVTSFGPSGIACSVTLTERDPFMKNGRVRAAVCLEYMAQAIAAQIGLQQREQGELPRPGYIIGVRSLRFHRAFLNAESRLEVHATMTWSDVHSATFEARVEHDGERVAEGQINVFQPPTRADLR